MCKREREELTVVADDGEEDRWWERESERMQNIEAEDLPDDGGGEGCDGDRRCEERDRLVVWIGSEAKGNDIYVSNANQLQVISQLGQVE